MSTLCAHKFYIFPAHFLHMNHRLGVGGLAQESLSPAMCLPFVVSNSSVVLDSSLFLTSFLTDNPNYINDCVICLKIHKDA